MKKRWQEKDKETTAGSAGYEKDERIMVVEQEIDGKKRKEKPMKTNEWNNIKENIEFLRLKIEDKKSQNY